MDGDDGSGSSDPDRTNLASLLDSLRRASKFQRIAAEDGNIQLISSTETFFCWRVHKEDDPVLHAVQHLFAKSFAKIERYPFWELKDIVKDSNFDLFVLEDTNRKVVGAVSGGYFKMEEGSNAIVFIDNIAVDPALRGRGLAKELYITLCEAAHKRAKENRHTIRAVLGEAKNEVEIFWNRLGWKRLYAFDLYGVLREIPYVTPPLRWNWNTGLPQEGHGSVPQHLMAWIADGKKNALNCAEMVKTIELIFEMNFTPSEQRFASPQAYKVCLETLRELINELRRKLSKGKLEPVIGMTFEERQKAGL